MSQSLEQQRALHASKVITKASAELNKEQFKLFVSQTNSLPASIISLGLGQSLAMLLTKDKPERKELFNALESWLFEVPTVIYTKHPQDNLMKQILDKDQYAYRTAQMESIAYLSWLKKFASAAELERKSKANNQEGEAPETHEAKHV